MSRPQPLATADARPGAAAFRHAMAEVTHAVHIVTTKGSSGPAGLTATAVASVSDAPPTLLVCIDAGSRTLASIAAGGVFCVNTLGEDDHALAEIFANRGGVSGEARFAHGVWRAGVTGSPVLASALAAFDCRLVSVHEAATHRILIGEVVGLDGAPGARRGLVHRRRGYAAV